MAGTTEFACDFLTVCYLRLNDPTIDSNSKVVEVDRFELALTSSIDITRTLCVQSRSGFLRHGRSGASCNTDRRSLMQFHGAYTCNNEGLRSPFHAFASTDCVLSTCDSHLIRFAAYIFAHPLPSLFASHLTRVSPRLHFRL